MADGEDPETGRQVRIQMIRGKGWMEFSKILFKPGGAWRDD